MTVTSAPIRTARSALFAPLAWLWATPTRKRATIGVLAVAAIGAVGVAAAVAWLLWRLSSGPIPLDSLNGSIEQAVAEQLGDVAVAIEGAELATGRDGGTVIRLTDVKIIDQSGQTVIRAPEAVVGTRLITAAVGSIAPTSIELFGPHISVRRSADGGISLGFAQPSSAERIAEAAAPPPEATGDTVVRADAAPSFSPVNLFAAAADDQGFLGTVNQLLVRQARLTLYDEASQSIWDSFNATLGISRKGSGIAVYVDAPFVNDSGEWHINLTVEQDNDAAPVLVEAKFDNVVPAEIAARSPTLADFAGLMLPVSGRVAATVSAGGELDAVVGDLRLGAGFVRQLPFSKAEITPFLVDEGRIAATYDRAKASLQLDQLSLLVGPNRINLSGAVVPERDANGTMVGAQFDLRSDGLRLAADDLAREAAVIERALASGRIAFDPLELELDTITVDLPRGSLTLGATAALQSPRSVNLRGTIEDLPASSLVQLWPRGLAPGARAWIADNMPQGRVGEAKIAVSLGEDDIAAAEQGQPIRDDAVSIEFSFDGVTAHYLDPLPPIEQGSGTALLTGDRFVLSVDDARIVPPAGAPIAVTFGRFEVPSLVDDENGQIGGRINIGTLSTTTAALEVLDLEPLGFAREVGVVPANVGGEATILVDLALPLEKEIPLSAVQIQAGATLKKLTIPDAFRSISLESPSLEIIATHKRIEARGDVRLNGVAANAVWDARLDQPGGRTNRLTMSGEVDAADLEQLGIDLTEFLNGTVPVSIEATGRGSSLDEFVVGADATNAEIRLHSIGWRKPHGEAASLDFTVERLDNGQIRLRNIDLDGDGIAVEGAIRLDPDGSLYKADLSRVRLGPANDLVLNGVRGGDGVLQIKVRGREVDATAMLRRALSGAEPPEPDPTARPVVIDFSIDSILGENASVLSGASGRVQLREAKVSAIRLSGRFDGKSPIEVNYGVGAGASQAVVSIDTDDAGAFVRFLGFYTRAQGGKMTVRARGPDSRSLGGKVTVRQFKIEEEPLLAKIAATASGLSPRAARNVRFSVLNLDFERHGAAWEIGDALIAGPAVGASLRGNIDMGAETMNVSGTYIPAYGFNAAFGAIPLVGPILSGRSGEGVFGMTYAVNGPMNDLAITINPVSTIAPGLLRRLFEIRER